MGEYNRVVECEYDNAKWYRRADARAVCGVGRDLLDKWVAEGKVEAHKLDQGRNGTVVFNASDINKVIRESPVYAPSKIIGFSSHKRESL